MPAITKCAADQTEYLSCLGRISEVGLECKGCRGFTYLRCSELPEHQLLRLYISQASYCCRMCVKPSDMSGEDYEKNLMNIREAGAKEESLVEETDADIMTEQYTAAVAVDTENFVEASHNVGQSS